MPITVHEKRPCERHADEHRNCEVIFDLLSLLILNIMGKDWGRLVKSVPGNAIIQSLKYPVTDRKT